MQYLIFFSFRMFVEIYVMELYSNFVLSKACLGAHVWFHKFYHVVTSNTFVYDSYGKLHCLWIKCLNLNLFEFETKKWLRGFVAQSIIYKTIGKNGKKTIKSLAWKFLRNCPFKFFIAIYNLIIQYFYVFWCYFN